MQQDLTLLYRFSRVSVKSMYTQWGVVKNCYSKKNVHFREICFFIGLHLHSDCATGCRSDITTELRVWWCYRTSLTHRHTQKKNRSAGQTMTELPGLSYNLKCCPLLVWPPYSVFPKDNREVKGGPPSWDMIASNVWKLCVRNI